MKKNVLTVFFKILPMLAIALLLFGCKNDDNNTTDKVVGTWKYIGDIDEGIFDGDVESCYIELVKFEKNGNASININDCGDSDAPLLFNWKKTAAANNYEITNGTETSVFTAFFTENNKRMTIADEDNAANGQVYAKQ